jgi:uncharacterized protein YbdZ (MbtH family)
MWTGVARQDLSPFSQSQLPSTEKRSTLVSNLSSNTLELLMAVNPFDDDDVQFFVVSNNEGQHAIWPEFSAVPPGWRVMAGPHDRRQCLDYIEENWVDMRPSSMR